MAVPEGRYWHGFVCLNQSSGPISDLRIESEGTQQQRAVHAYPLDLGPGERYEGQLAVPFGPVPRLRLDFNDGKSRRWRRDFDGRISRRRRVKEFSRVGVVPVYGDVNMDAGLERKPTEEDNEESS
jgi:hypothetical protein